MVALNSLEFQLSSIMDLISNNVCYGRINISTFKSCFSVALQSYSSLYSQGLSSKYFFWRFELSTKGYSILHMLYYSLTIFFFDVCHAAQYRMHEATSAETKRSKRKRCEVWGENPNPNDWRRVDGWPVGLKNVGNTCWFSAVIQV